MREPPAIPAKDLPAPCPCGLPHANPQPKHGFCRNCPCVAAYRGLLAMCARYDLVYARWLKSQGVGVRSHKRGPKISVACECTVPTCKAPYLAAHKDSKWCPDCRPEQRRLHKLEALKAKRAEKRQA